MSTDRSALPEWRAGAPAGISLSAAMARNGPTMSAVKAPTDIVQTGSLPAELRRIIRPEAAPRWRSARVSQYTPQYVEYVLGNALAGDITAQWEMFDLMEETWPRLAKNLGEVKRSVAAMKWTVTAWSEDNNPPTEEAEQRAKLVSHILWRMRPEAAHDERGFTGIVYDLLDAWGKGVSLVELIWEERTLPSLGQIAAVRAGQWVHPDNYGVDDRGWIGLRVEPNRGMMHRGSAVEPLPPYKFLVGIAKAKTSHFIGAALLRPLAWWWAASNFSATWMLNYAQLFGIPMRWANYPSGASQALVEKVCEALEQMGSQGWVAFPEGTALELHEGSKTAGSSPQEGIQDRADKQCDLLVLGQTLTTDASDKGTQALGTVHERVRSDVIQSAADWVAGVLTQQLVPMVLELNYGDAEQAPELKAEPVREKDEAANAQRIATVLGAGIEVPKGWLYEYLDIPMPQAGEETVGHSQSPMADGQNQQRRPGGARFAQDSDEQPDSTEAGKSRNEARQSTAGHRRIFGGYDPAALVAERKAAVLGAAYRGAMAPFRAAILASTSPEDAMQRVRGLYADWHPDRVARLVEEALQIAAAAGAADGKA